MFLAVNANPSPEPFQGAGAMNATQTSVYARGKFVVQRYECPSLRKQEASGPERHRRLVCPLFRLVRFGM